MEVRQFFSFRMHILQVPTDPERPWSKTFSRSEVKCEQINGSTAFVIIILSAASLGYWTFVVATLFAQKVIAVYLPVLWIELLFTAILELVEMIASLAKIDELYYRIK